MSLPKGWAISTVAELAAAEPRSIVDGPFGSALKSNDYTSEGVRVIRLSNLGSGVFESHDVAFVSHEKYDLLRAHDARPGDIVVAALGDPVGRACIVPEDIGTAIVKADCFRVRVSSELDKRFLLSALNSPQVREHFSEQARGVGRLRINLEILRSACLPLPPLAEQRRIVAKLDALTARTARARAELDRASLLSSPQRQSLLRAAVSGELTALWRTEHETESVTVLLERVKTPKQGRGGREATDKIIAGTAGISLNDPGSPLPRGWAWVPLLRIAKQETGHTPSRGRSDYWDGEVPWIGIRDAGQHHGRQIQDTMQTITEAGLANSSARLLPAGTVCLSRTASVGYVTMMARPMATSQDFATWTCTEALLPEYLMYALMAEGEDIRKFGMGSTHTTIYFPEIRALHIALPPLEEQREIIRVIKSALARADRLEAEAARARKLLDRLESALLAKAFQGELVSQDPNDEPASVLLERIRAERAATPKAKRGRRATS